MDVPAISTSSPPHVPPASEHMSSLLAPLHNVDPSSKSRVESSVSTSNLLDYSSDQPVIPNHWDGSFYVLSIFSTEKT